MIASAALAAVTGRLIRRTPASSVAIRCTARSWPASALILAAMNRRAWPGHGRRPQPGGSGHLAGRRPGRRFRARVPARALAAGHGGPAAGPGLPAAGPGGSWSASSCSPSAAASTAAGRPGLAQRRRDLVQRPGRQRQSIDDQRPVLRRQRRLAELQRVHLVPDPVELVGQPAEPLGLRAVIALQPAVR